MDEDTKMTGMSPVMKRQWQNAERIRRYGSGLTDKEFQGREEILKEDINWAKPTPQPAPMPVPKKAKIIS